jgi:hypothetical protein
VSSREERCRWRVKKPGMEIKVSLRGWWGKGFDGGVREMNVIGLNEDGKMELFVEGMPEYLVLLSAKQSADDGAAILFGVEGWC